MPPNSRERTEAEGDLILATDLIKDCALTCYEELVKSEGSSAPPEMCMIIEEFMNGVLMAVDADQQFRYQRLMNVGDASCLWMLGQVRH